MRMWHFIPFFLLVCARVLPQAPENPIVQQKRLDSLQRCLTNIPENSGSANDTLRLNILFAILRRTEGAVQKKYMDEAMYRCEQYSPLVVQAENMQNAELKSRMDEDAFLSFFLRIKTKLLLKYGETQESSLERINYFLRALNLAEKTENKTAMAGAYLSISYVYSRQKNFSKSTENLLKAITIYKTLGNKNREADAYCTLGEISHQQLKFEEAAKHYTTALKIATDDKNLFGQAIYHEYLGNCYNDAKNYKKAIEHHTASMAISEQLKDVKGVGDSYGDITSIYLNNGDYINADINARKALEKYREFGNTALVGNAFLDLAKVKGGLKKYADALQLLDSALIIYLEEKDSYREALTHFEAGKILLTQHKDEKALTRMKSAIAIGQKEGYFELLKDVYESLSGFYREQQDYKTAFSYQDLFHDMKDSLIKYGDETAERLEAIQTGYDIEKRKQEKLLNEAVLAEKEARLKQEAILRYSLFGGLAVLLLAGGYVFNRYKASRRQQKIIEKQKKIVEEKNKEIHDSINYAERIQRSFLATHEQLNAYLGDYFVLFKPKDVVSGDFYWSSVLADGNFVLVTADSTGHGVPGAIMSILNISSLEEAVKNGLTGTGKILDYTRHTIIERLKKDGSADGGKDGMDCSLISFNRQQMTLRYAAANNPVWVIRNGELKELLPDKMPVGKHDLETQAFTERTFLLQKDDLVITLTDGFADQFGGPKGKKFKYKQLKECLLNNATLSLQQQKEKLTEQLQNWMQHHEQVDDITIVGFRI